MGPSLPVSMWNVLEICLLATITQASIYCNSTHYIDFGQTGEVSCEYPLSFLSVRWYREDDITPIVFIEGGTKKVTPGYDIKVDGDLVISKVGLEDEGNYTISVLSRLGRNEKRNLKFYVTVPLSSKPILENCLSSKETLCLMVDARKRGTTLLCTAHNARPAVNLEWYAIIGEGYQTVKETASKTIINKTSTMYQSSSILSYDQTAFSLQSFKCTAMGVAVKSSLEASKLVEGLRSPPFVNQNNVAIEVNSNLDLKCSETSYQVGRWKINYNNGTSLRLPGFFPGHVNSNYVGDGRYIVQNNGSISVHDITQADEATYECLYFDGYETGLAIAIVTVIVNPNPTAIVIQGCTEFKECEIDVTQRGVLKASVFGSRPFAELSCVLGDVLHSEALLTNGKIQMVVHPDSGTYDTIYTVEFDIPKCSMSVHVICRVSPGSFDESLSPVDVFLTTGTLGCGESSGQLGIALVLVIVILVFLSIVVIFVLKRSKVSCRRIKDEEHTTEETITLTKKNDVDLLLQQLCENYEEHFQDFMKNWDNFKTDSFGTLTDSLSDLFQTQQFSVDDFLTLLSENLKEKKISHTTFVDFTGKLFGTNQVLTRKFLTSLCFILQESVLTSKELTHMMKQYSETYKISIEDFMAVLKTRTKEKEISHSKFVYIMVQLCSAEQLTEEKLSTAVHAVLHENVISTDGFVTALNENIKEKKISKPAFFNMTGQLFNTNQLPKTKLLTSLYTLLQDDVLTIEEFTQIIHQYSVSYKISVDDYMAVLSENVKGKEISHATVVQIIGLLLSSYQLSEEKLLFCVHAVLKEGELSIDDFMTALRQNMKKNKIPHSTFVHMTGKLLSANQLSKEKLLTSLYALLQKSAITREELIRMIMQYHLSYKMDIEIVSKGEKGGERIAMISYPYYLQEIHKLRMKGSDDDKLFQCFEDILKKKLCRNGLSILTKNITQSDAYEVISYPGKKEDDQHVGVEEDQEDKTHQSVSNSPKENHEQKGYQKYGKKHGYYEIKEPKPYVKDITVVFVEALLCSVEDEVMNHSDCETMLETGIAEKRITPNNCRKALQESSRQQWINDDTQLQFLGRKFWVDMISKPTCIQKALKLLVQEKIQQQVFIQWLLDGLESKVMAKECFEKHMTNEIIQGKEKFWFQFITKLKTTILTEKHKDEDLARTLFKKVVKTTKIKPKILKGFITDMNITEEEKMILFDYFK